MKKQLFRMLCVLFVVVVVVSGGVLYSTFDPSAIRYLANFKGYYALLALLMLSIGLFLMPPV